MTIRVRHVHGGYTMFMGDDDSTDDVVSVRRSARGVLYCLFCQMSDSDPCRHITVLRRYLSNQRTET